MSIKIARPMRRMILAGGSVILLTMMSGVANAEEKLNNANLRGVFPFNETIIGAVAPTTAAACPTALSSSAQQLTLTNQGTWAFDGAGHMLAEDTGVLMTAPGQGGAFDVIASAATCPGTYNVQQDGTVQMVYTCSVPAGPGATVQFDVQSKGVLTPTNMLVAIPPATGGGTRVLNEYFTVGGTRTLIACVVIGENTNVVRTRKPGQRWPVD